MNSDVLFAKRLISTKLPRHIEQFFRDAKEAGAVLVIPRTTLLEYERIQSERSEELALDIENAAGLLTRLGVAIPKVDAAALAKAGDLPTLAHAAGITVEIEAPVLEDYQDAERRACLHLSPQPPSTRQEDEEEEDQPDEMRDLVIWAVALRVARRDGRALLVSRDEVHSHERGGEEATACGLLRARTFDEALELLGRETPAGALARRLLTPVWQPLRAAGLPLRPELTLRRVTHPTFTADALGRATLGVFSFATNVDGGILTASVLLQQTPGAIKCELSQVMIGPNVWHDGSLSTSVPGELPVVASPTQERLEALRENIT